MADNTVRFKRGTLDRVEADRSDTINQNPNNNFYVIVDGDNIVDVAIGNTSLLNTGGDTGGGEGTVVEGSNVQAFPNPVQYRLPLYSNSACSPSNIQAAYVVCKKGMAPSSGDSVYTFSSNTWSGPYSITSASLYNSANNIYRVTYVQGGVTYTRYCKRYNSTWSADYIASVDENRISDSNLPTGGAEASVEDYFISYKDFNNVSKPIYRIVVPYDYIFGGTQSVPGTGTLQNNLSRVICKQIQDSISNRTAIVEIIVMLDGYSWLFRNDFIGSDLAHFSCHVYNYEGNMFSELASIGCNRAQVWMQFDFSAGSIKWGVLPIAESTGGNEYTLPVASTTTLGGVKIGNGLRADSTGLLDNSISLSQTASMIIGDNAIGYTYMFTIDGAVTERKYHWLYCENVNYLGVGVYIGDPKSYNEQYLLVINKNDQEMNISFSNETGGSMFVSEIQPIPPYHAVEYSLLLSTDDVSNIIGGNTVIVSAGAPMMI